MASVLRTKISKLRAVVEGRSPYARAYASHSSGDPQDDAIEPPEADRDEYEAALKEFPKFLRDLLEDPEEKSEVDRQGTSTDLTGYAELRNTPELHIPDDAYFAVGLSVVTTGEEDADEDGYSWATSTTVSYTLETLDDAFEEEAGSASELKTKLRRDLDKFMAALKASVPEQYHNKLK